MTKNPAENVLHLQVPMRWGDMDAYGHINNVSVVRMLEEARVHAFGPPAGTGAQGTKIELPVFNDLPPNVQALVVEHRVKYSSPLNYRNIPADVELWVSAIKAASFSVAYAIGDPVTGMRCVWGETVLAFFDEAAQTLLRLPPEKKAMLERLLGESPFK